ncbi:AbrB/MazE/SpoVT family DNA-binding domain-containing protein [Desulfospira joergensenii]|uniref:AbrB/MazE/SpoVT family DNA-binding domain-containing protein n=1 Tax=Desulfospira joergensenii TaxID=53329 RepID=UPI0003B42A10|nr:AbrB/MazE/SpoVT family DNA-binding domain-containing protein [Desulfospira joergensenii]
MATLIKIGNSQGIRIPKAVIEQADLNDKELLFKVMDDGLLIQPVRKIRQGWKEKFDRGIDSGHGEETDREWLESPLTDDEDREW